VFAHVTVVPILQEGLLDGGEVVEALRAVRTVDEGRVFVVPGLRGLRRQPAIFTAGVLPVGDAFEREHAGFDVAADFPVLCFGDRGFRRRAAARRLVRGGLD